MEVVTACVGPPHALLVQGHGQLQVNKINHTYYVSCSKCTLTNCIDPTVGPTVFIVVHQPPYVVLPVKLEEHWYDDPGMYTIQLVDKALRRPKRFIAALILGITALIGIISSFAISTTALVQEIHTAHHMDRLTQNTSTALYLQEQIDKKFEARLNVLEETILYVGNQIQNLKTRLTTRCHAQYKWICVTPHHYDSSSVPWDNVKNHLLGIWSNDNVSLDLSSLQEKIKDISLAHVSSATASEVADSFLATLQKYTTTAWFPSLINLGISALIIISLLFLFPVFIITCYESMEKQKNPNI